MKEVVKICKYHGELTIDDVKPEQKRNGIYYRCHKCKLIKDQKWKVVHREQHIQASIDWKKNNRDKVNEWNREDRKKDPEKYSQWQKDYRERTGPLIHSREISRVRGISLEEYEQMFIDQENRCEICKKQETRKSRTSGEICRLTLDHCHKTGKIRSLLCHSCNVAIGSFRDDPLLLKSAIAYLESHQHI